MIAYEQEKQVAIAAVSVATELCEQVRRERPLAPMEKQDHSPVTVADLGAQAVICRAIAVAFPSDPIVAEEDAALLQQPAMEECLEQVTTHVRAIEPDATPEAVITWINQGQGQVGSRYWTLDPIDGNKGFLRGDQYAIALALVEAGKVKLGVLGCPALPVDMTQPNGERGVLFVAVSGQGTLLMPLHGGRTQSIHICRTKENSAHRLIESVESRHGNLPLQRMIAQAVGLTAPPLQMDSQAKYGAVARGEAALYLRLPWTELPDYRENIWDHAAGAIVVEEAGGQVTDIHGKPLDFTLGPKLISNRGIVASNSTLHKLVLKALREQAIGVSNSKLSPH